MHSCMTGVVLFDRMFSIEVFFILCSRFSNTADVISSAEFQIECSSRKECNGQKNRSPQ